MNECKDKMRNKLAYNVTEDILVLMEDVGVTKAELAKRMGCYVEG